MTRQTLSLSERHAKFISRHVKNGHYRSASEVVGTALRLLEQREQMDMVKLDALRRLAKESFAQVDRGDFEIVGTGGVDPFITALENRMRSSGMPPRDVP